MNVTQTPPSRGQEPPMFIQRPSSGKSQDVRHILSRVFRDLFTRDAIGADTVKNLTVSKDGSDPYHERYVNKLQKVFEERQKRLDEAAMLERHIMQAQARAMSADEKALNRVAKTCTNYDELGLPPGRSHFRSCLDTNLLRKHNLLTPDDYALEENIIVPPPSAPAIPSYARDTVTSQQHSAGVERGFESPLPPIPTDSNGLIQTFISEDFSDTESEAVEKDKVKFPKNDSWKSHMNEERREMDRRDLTNLDSKVNFLKNPRHIPPSAGSGGRTIVKFKKKIPKEVGIQSKPVKEKLKEPSVVFLSCPSIVTFTEYKVGQVYEMTLEFKNVSTSMRPCRVLPPYTSYFTIGLGQFPGEHGLVAPGMSCHYAIRFVPDSLCDFDDEIQLQTQSSAVLRVPLRGRREPPVITLPSFIDIGYCLVGGAHIAQLAIKNTGGTGRFCIIPRSSWPAHNFKSVVSNGSVHIPPFEIRPSVLELQKNQSGVIEVLFKPTQVKTYCEEMTLVCDNCHVKHFTLKGESQEAKIVLESVDKGLCEALPGELTDKSAQHLIKFDELNAYTYTERVFSVTNKANVEQPFQWMVYKPDIADREDTNFSENTDRVPDIDSVFSVHPTNGVIGAAATMQFKMMFAPPTVNKFHSVLHMLLQHVPSNVEALSRAASCKSLRSVSSVESHSSAKDDDSLSEVFIGNDIKPFQDVTALQLEVKGESVELNVVVHPYAVYIPGNTLIGTTVKKMVTMANHSKSTITFQWEPTTEEHILEIEPPFGELDPGMAMDMELSVTGIKPGPLKHTLYCYVLNMKDPVPLHVEADIKGPELIIEEPDINFGLVRFGNTVSREITLMNMSQVTTKWHVHTQHEESENEDQASLEEFSFSPSSGELKPLEGKKIMITFIPKTTQEYMKKVIQFEIEEGNSCAIAAFAEVQSPKVCLQSCSINLEEVYLDVPTICHATLINRTLLTSEYKWGPVEGEDSKDCSLVIDSMRGAVMSREEKNITIELTAHRTGNFNDLRLPCYIEDMEEPLYLALSCQVKGLSVEFKVTEDGPVSSAVRDEISLDFGEDVMLGSAPKLYLHICNNSAITTTYNVAVEHFIAKPPTPPARTDGQTQLKTTGQRRGLLGRTANLADPMSKTPDKAASDLRVAMLGNGLGAAFVIHPSSGTLQPFGEEILEVTAFSDMWGDYTDKLICKIGDIEDVQIPLKMNVIGCPLKFQMTAAAKDQPPVLRFGTHVSGIGVINRTMRINNTSPYDIRVDWEMYNVEPADTQQLIDLFVVYGKPFPLRDSDGYEIEPQETAVSPSPRQPTPTDNDMLPNSPSTATLSKRDTDMKDEDVDTTDITTTTPKKVISVFTRQHDGMMSDEIYNITPSQMVIPGRGTAAVNVSFRPPPGDYVPQKPNFFPPRNTEDQEEDHSPKEMDCWGYGLGYLSVEDKVATTQDKVIRPQTYEISNLRLDMTAHVKPALLTVECSEEDGMEYRAAMSDLLQPDGRTSSESFKECQVLLSNSTETPLTFKLKAPSPFILTNLDPSTNPDNSTRAHETSMHTLNPEHNLVVKVAFRTSTEFDLDDLETEDSSDSADGKKIEIKRNLEIHFSNTTIQTVPLHAVLTIPQFNLSKESLDFGVCLVGQTRELEFVISNTSSSHTYWMASLDEKSESCADDTFSVAPSSGLLEAYVTHISDSKLLVKLHFTAKHAEVYEASFLFHGYLGEEPRKLFVRGEGSYDGKHEAILNI